MTLISKNMYAMDSGNQNKKIVHIIFDDKFIDMAYREFETVAPGNNIFVILGKERPLQYVKNTNVTFLSYNAVKSLIESKGCVAIIFHSLNDLFLPILRSIPPMKKVIWLGWGYDYYQQLLLGAFPNGLLLNETASLMQKKPKSGSLIIFSEKIKRILKRLIGKTVHFSPKLLQKIDYFCPVIDVEYWMALELNRWFKPSFFSWNYGTVEDDLSINNHGISLGKNILVGNSATEENNHLEVFYILKKEIDYSSIKIIVPLSYGDEWYKNRVIEYGFSFFGDSFVPLVDFLDRNQYMEVLKSCGYVFMNHLRQQALGNICTMMLMGAKIYMNDISPLYHWLINKGASIYSINLLQGLTEKQQILSPLTDEERHKNLEVICNHWGRDVQRIKTRHLIDLVLR